MLQFLDAGLYSILEAAKLTKTLTRPSESSGDDNRDNLDRGVADNQWIGHRKPRSPRISLRTVMSGCS